MVYILSEQLIESTPEYVLKKDIPAVFFITEEELPYILEKLKISFEREYKIDDVYFCKAESLQDCIFGTLYIPKLLDILGSRFRLMFFINARHIVIVDNSGFALRILNRIKRRKIHQGGTKAKFMYNFMTEFMATDSELLERYEHRLMNLEEEALHDTINDFYQSHLHPVRKQLLTLRGYYDQLTELGKILEDDETHFFTEDELKYFGNICDRADRLMGKTIHLIDYAQQIKDIYQNNADAKQNKNMQFLTMISTIFFPLTLITGWFGMNFHNMPELENGYPAIKVLSIVVVIICIIIFKKKKIF